MARWDAFVPELLSLVQEILVKDYNDSKALVETVGQKKPRNAKGAVPTPPLLHLARVNRHWNAVARRDMYERVFVHKEQTMKLLARTLQTSPDLLELIKSFTVDYRYNDLPTQAKARQKEKANRTRTSKLTWQVLKQLRPRKLAHLSVEENSLSPMPDLEERSLPCLLGLSSLAINVRGYVVSELTTPWFQTAAPTLRSFKAPNSNRGIEDLKGALDQPFKLTGLYLPAQGTRIDDETFTMLVKNSALTDLSFNDLPQLQHATFAREMNRLAAGLHRLHIGAAYSGQRRIFPRLRSDYIQAICSMLNRCNHLRVLHVSATGDELATSIARTIPHSVHRLAIQVEDVATETGGLVRNLTVEDVLKVIDAVFAEDFPKLRLLDLTFRRIHWKDGGELTDELTRRIPEAAAKSIMMSYTSEFPYCLPLVL